MYTLQMMTALRIAYTTEFDDEFLAEHLPTHIIGIVQLIRKIIGIVDVMAMDELARHDTDGNLEDNSEEVWAKFRDIVDSMNNHSAHIENDMYLFMVSLYPKFIQCIDPRALTYELCMAAVATRGDTIQYITERRFLTEELYQTAVDDNGFALRYIQNPSDAVILKAIYNEPVVVKDINVQQLTPVMAFTAIMGSGSLLGYLIVNEDNLNFEITRDMIDKATFRTPFVIEALTELPTFQNNDDFFKRIYMTSVCRDPEVYSSVPEEYKTDQMAYVVVYNYAHDIIYLPDVQRKLLYKTAVMLDPTVLGLIPQVDMTQAICDAALNRKVIVSVIFNA